ncbi:MAG: NAD-dependent malic enzyme, partial [Candidatus Gracilibacteria bacterium]|nr:NAD-dependent malic enzyme [Candidatus Gracilibacteria bacterium]
DMNIPVFHDDQHGTAIVVLAGLINALKVVQKQLSEIRIVISGSGAAGIAISNLLSLAGANDIIICDSQGAICPLRQNLNSSKEEVLKRSNPRDLCGSLSEVIEGADLFVGVSAPDVMTADDVRKMADKSIVFAMSNPSPEIMPEEAKKGGAYIVATGRSDFPNQLNNVLVFPGIFKGALQARTQITDEMKLAAAQALSDLVHMPNPDKIIPHPLDKGIAEAVAEAVIRVARKQELGDSFTLRKLLIR